MKQMDGEGFASIYASLQIDRATVRPSDFIT